LRRWSDEKTYGWIILGSQENS
jgi:hypothetical protein